MNRDPRNFGLLLLALIAVLFWLRRRPKPTLTQTSVRLIGARSETGELNPAYTDIIKDDLNQAFQRICHYTGSSINWPSLTDPCPPNLNGQALVSDTLEQRL